MRWLARAGGGSGGGGVNCWRAAPSVNERVSADSTTWTGREDRRPRPSRTSFTTTVLHTRGRRGETPPGQRSDGVTPAGLGGKFPGLETRRPDLSLARGLAQ